jgi:hypothetical protein
MLTWTGTALALRSDRIALMPMSRKLNLDMKKNHLIRIEAPTGEGRGEAWEEAWQLIRKL